MADITGMDHKFTVIKNEDIARLAPGYADLLNLILSQIALDRMARGKDTAPIHLVINEDEFYAGEVIEILKRNGHWG
ncbi:hypothetical protein [Paenibacillus donghaensis]|uniref:Uncharacterized protein n=1 Tax=Paenibacillus donghaensis TaxID=414771 RepID=A0A2Z2KB92_9BACL|nr:hypothetical protein [Paenibacillus donghaensis]ASA20915.1 hypothetical protein B9T62_09035 [Paenibacillus donghaensis]